MKKASNAKRRLCAEAAAKMTLTMLRERDAGRESSGIRQVCDYHFPSEIIQHAVWLCYRFTLSFRDVEGLLAPQPASD